MKILFLLCISFLVPTICSAHSGTVLKAVSTYLPFMVPVVAGVAAFGRRWIHQWMKKFRKDK